MRRTLAAAMMFAQFGAGSTSTSGPVSPSVMATVMCVTTERGVGTLELLVLWRGGPGWYWRDREKGGDDQNDADQVTQRNTADKKQCEQNRSPDDRHAQVGLHKDKKTGSADDGAAECKSGHRMHLAKLA